MFPSPLPSTLLATLLGLAALQAHAVPVYSNDFQSGVGAEWSSPLISATPTPYPFGPRLFLGEFGNEQVNLSLGEVGAATLRLEFDFFAIRSWDGSSVGTTYDYGDDHFRVAVVGGPPLFDATFSNGNPAGQSHGPAANNPYHSGAAETYSLGYYFYDGIQESGQVMDSVYRLGFDFAHAGGALTLSFSGYGLQTLDDESWGLDNVLLSANGLPASALPAPGTAALLSLGLLGLAGARRRQRA